MFNIVTMFKGLTRGHCFTVSPSLMTVPCSCPTMETTWTWNLPWQSREMNWRDFRRKEGKISITSGSGSFSFALIKLQKETMFPNNKN